MKIIYEIVHNPIKEIIVENQAARSGNGLKISKFEVAKKVWAFGAVKEYDDSIVVHLVDSMGNSIGDFVAAIRLSELEEAIAKMKEELNGR